MEAPMGTESNPKAFKHKMSLRQAAEGKRKGSLNVFKGKKGLTVLSCSLENHVINWANKTDQLRMNLFYSWNHIKSSTGLLGTQCGKN